MSRFGLTLAGALALAPLPSIAADASKDTAQKDTKRAMAELNVDKAKQMAAEIQAELGK